MLLLLALLASLQISFAGIDQIAFRYTSNHHIAPADRFVSVNAGVDEVSAALLRFIALHGGRIESDEELPGGQVIEISEDGQRCWQATAQVARQELRAIAANDATALGKIQRESPCVEISFATAPSGLRVRRIMARVDRRNLQVGSSTMTLETRLGVRIWGDESSTTA